MADELINEHTCPGGCGRTIHHDRYVARAVCPQCWRRLPAELQTPILIAHWADDHAGYSRAVTAAMHWFRERNPFWRTAVL